MTNIYNLEPQASGHIKFDTSFGEVDIELFTKQCPKACKNFTQLCLDDYYKDSIFERVEKDFIAVGGVVNGVNLSKYQLETSPDEFHPRLKFSRRGLLATANEKKNDNGPKFFFTLGPTPELQNKHTIFGRVKGNSIYNLVELNDCQVDGDNKPFSELKIIDLQVIDNPFSDLKPRQLPRLKQEDNGEESDLDTYDPLLKPRTVQTKNLSFYDDSDDEDDEDDESEKPVQPTTIDNKKGELVGQNQSKHKEQTTEVLLENKKGDLLAEEGESSAELDSESEEDAKERRLREIREQIQKLTDQPEIVTLSERRKETLKRESSESSSKESDEASSRLAGKKAKLRERDVAEKVIAIKESLLRAKKRLKSEDSKVEISKISRPIDEIDEFNLLAELDVDDDSWRAHKLILPEDNSVPEEDSDNQDRASHRTTRHNEKHHHHHRERERERDHDSKHRKPESRYKRAH